MNKLLDAGLSRLGLGPNVKDLEEDKTKEGIASNEEKDLTLKSSNEDLVKRAKDRQLEWEDSMVYADLKRKGKENEKYWLGEHYTPTNLDITRPNVDNAIFEAMETHIPMATRKNPEPMVTLANGEEETDENNTFTKKLMKKLAEVADEIKLRLRLKTAARFNELYLLAVAKMGWDLENDIPTAKIIRPEKLILDPKAHIDPSDGYTGKFIGEYKKMESAIMLRFLEDKGGEAEGKKLVKKLVKKSKGTDIRFIEWSERDKVYWTLGTTLLFKMKNVNWNEDEGATNHFKAPRLPYVFLSVLNLGKAPVDETSNTCQNLSNQDRLNKRNRQIDKAIDKQNGGTVISLANAGLTQETVPAVTRALQKGGTVAIPNGIPEHAIKHIAGVNLPADVYNDRNDVRARIKDTFGVRGSSSSGLLEDKTVRGKHMNSQKDGDRVGGSVAEYLEQYSDDIYNWFVQLLYVHDEAFDGAAPRIKVSVKEGSLLPKDSASIAAEATELSVKGKMSTLDLYKRLDYSNPEELAANAWLELNAPEVLYSKDPRIAQVMQQRAQSAQAGEQKPPSTSIPYDSLTPDSQSQLLAKAGITADPKAIAAHGEHKANEEDDRELKKAERMPKPEKKVEKK